MSGTQMNATISVAAILAESASRFADSTALTLGPTEISYATLWAQTRQFAGLMRGRGIERGDRVAVLMPNIPHFAHAYYGTLALGGIVVPVHALLKADEIEYVLRDSGAKVLIVAAPLLAEGAKGAAQAGVEVLTVLEPEKGQFERIEDLLPGATPIRTYEPMQPSDTATILYTSGTTGQPKGAEGSHFSLVEQTNVLLLNTFDLKAGDVIMGTLPLFHTFGQTAVLNTGIRAGATIVLVPRFDGDAALKEIAEREVDIFFGVPTMYIGLLEAQRRNPTKTKLRYGISGGAAIPVAVIDKFRELFGAEIYEGYGLTETSPVASFNHIGRPPKAGSIGTPIWGVEVEIAEADVEDRIELLPTGEQGEIVIRGHLLFKGYHNKPEATAAAIVDGWFRSGDVGFKDEDGYITIVDRKKDMILRNGYNVYPREVEEVVATHPDVISSAVFGVPHETHGQEIAVAAVKVEDSTLTEDELIEYVKTRIAAYKYPRIAHFVDSLPLNSSGKVLKRELQVQFGA